MRGGVRIIAGHYRGLSLTVPKGLVTRPSSDRLRETLFNLLAHGREAALYREKTGKDPVAGQLVLDAFAGTGALGIEALSRGAASAVFMEKARPVLAALRANLARLPALQQEGRLRVIAGDTLAPPRASSAAGLVFLDPPYGAGLEDAALPALQKAGWIDLESLVVIEAAAGNPPELPKGFTLLGARRVGQAQLLFSLLEG